MKGMKTIGLLGAAIVLAGVSDAAAQAPTLSVSANGATVTINWTSVPGATGYNLVVSGSLTADVNLPASITNIVVNAPAGTYTLRVRATAGGLAGPFSNNATVTVGTTPGPGPGPGPCQPPAAPSISTAVNGGVVTVSWGAVAGASSYQLQFSRQSGGTELVQNTTQTSYVQFVGLIGTFYVRVAALSPCGNTTSSEAAFTITTLTGNLPRTPDPAPGQLLPKPTYGQAIVQQMAAQFPGDLRNSCHETGGNNIWMFRVVNALRQRDSRWGMNQKRGNQGLSQDIVTYNPTAIPDPQAQQIYLWDIIFSHCGSNPNWNWGDVTAATWQGGQSGASGCANAWCALWFIPAEYFQRGFQ